MYKAFKALSVVNLVVGTILISLPLVYLVIINTPQIWYAINPDALNAEVRTLTQTPVTGELKNELDAKAATSTTNAYTSNIKPVLIQDFKPPLDPSLSTTNELIIPRIGINGPIFTGASDTTLNKGIWLMPGFGDPEKYSLTTILAAHRWGYDDLSQDYREKNLFYNLPQVQPGDDIMINWNQRQYKYKVVYKEESDYVSRLTDLILMTCKFYASPLRIIVYAQRTN